MPAHSKVGMIKSLYIIGALKNPNIPTIANRIEHELGIEAFAAWASPGPEADQFWRAYELERGRSYREAINGYHAWNVFNFDKKHLRRCDGAVLILPAGRSGHLELGYAIGLGKPGWVLFDEEPQRFDLMYRFATDVCFTLEELIEAIKKGCPTLKRELQDWCGL